MVNTPESFRRILQMDEIDQHCLTDGKTLGEMIQEAAYFNWLNAGCPQGRDVEFWCEAERQIVGSTADEIYADLERTREEDLREERAIRMASMVTLGIPATMILDNGTAVVPVGLENLRLFPRRHA